MAHARIDWHAWHSRYANQDSPLSHRLAVVQAQLSTALSAQLDAELDSPLQLVSLCAGQGLDVIDVLAGYPYASHVNARLVERDERNAAVARQRANEAGPSQVVVADAARLAA